MIRVHEPVFAGNEKKYLNECIDTGMVSSSGEFVSKFEIEFARWSGNDYAVAVSSGTAAVETALWASGYPGDSISIPVGTIVSCFNSAVSAGYHVRFHDNDSMGNGVGIMRCHLFGSLDNTEGYPVLDDLSQYWEPFRVETTGAYSLFANKMITSGEGGMVVTNDPDIYQRAVDYRNLCHSNTRFIHNELGYNFRMSNIQAALGLAQLEQIDKFISIKQKNRDLYLKHLDPSIISLFKVNVPWMYLIETKHDAGAFVKILKDMGVEARRFFYPLNKQPFINEEGNYPVAEHLWKHAFYIPSGLTLTEEDIINVSRSIRSVLRFI